MEKEQTKTTKTARFLKNDAKQRYTLGVVYEPNVEDTQGDYAEADEIEKACWKFTKFMQGNVEITKAAVSVLQAIQKALNQKETVQLDVTALVEQLQKADSPLGYQHFMWDANIGDIVENYIAPVDMQLGDEKITKGTWLMGVVWSQDYFDKIQKGEITGFSMGGSGVRIPDGKEDSNE